jgi:guanine deaminase
VLDPRATPAMAHRMARIEGDLAATLFLLMILGDERTVRATYVLGQCQPAAAAG